MIFDDYDGQWCLGMEGPKLSCHLSYSWGKTPEKTSTRKTDPIRDQTGPASWEATILPLDHRGGLVILEIE